MPAIMVLSFIEHRTGLTAPRRKAEFKLMGRIIDFRGSCLDQLAIVRRASMSDREREPVLGESLAALLRLG